MSNVLAKRPWTAPALVIYGSVEEITQQITVDCSTKSMGSADGIMLSSGQGLTPIGCGTS